MLGFGGVAAVGRYIIVEEKKWLSDKEFATYLGIGQILPGANYINLSIIVGNKHQGKIGSLISVIGIFLIPAIVVIIFAELYNKFSVVPEVHTLMVGAGITTIGMIIGNGIRMLTKLNYNLSNYLIIILAIALIAIFHFRIGSTLLCLIPFSIIANKILNK
jgi:chromate transporter